LATTTLAKLTALTPLTSGCSDIISGYCELRFKFDAITTVYIPQANVWTKAVDNVSSRIGSCKIDSTGLTITPVNNQNQFIAECVFQVCLHPRFDDFYFYPIHIFTFFIIIVLLSSQTC
jgi:hypothetical protein